MLRANGALCRITLVALASAALALAARRGGEEGRVLDDKMHHLGGDQKPDWQEAPAAPEPSPLEIRFESRANEREWLLEITARDVHNDWALELNGKEFARLKNKGNTALVAAYYPVPEGLIVRGRNTLTVRPKDQPEDDLTVGRVRLFEKSLREVAHLGRVDVRVSERSSGKPIPARVTVARDDGTLLDVYYAERPSTAVRPGIAYTSDGLAALEVPEG